MFADVGANRRDKSGHAAEGAPAQALARDLHCPRVRQLRGPRVRTCAWISSGEKGVRGDAERGVMVEAPPAPPFEVIQPQLRIPAIVIAQSGGS